MLDVFTLQAVPGLTGALLVPIFCLDSFIAVPEKNRGILFGWQLLAGIIIWVWTFCFSFLLMKLCDRIVGVNISVRAEKLGLDLIEHGE